MVLPLRSASPEGRHICGLGHRPQKTPQLLVPAGRDPGPGPVPAISRPDGLRGGAYRSQYSRRVVVVGGIRGDRLRRPATRRATARRGSRVRPGAAGRRDAYAAEMAAVARPGADFYLVGIADPPAIWRPLGARGVSAGELCHRFGADFDLAD